MAQQQIPGWMAELVIEGLKAQTKKRHQRFLNAGVAVLRAQKRHEDTRLDLVTWTQDTLPMYRDQAKDYIHSTFWDKLDGKEEAEDN